MTRREEFTAWICAQTGSAYVWGAQGHKVRRDGTVYMNQRKVSDNFESWVRQRENGEENAARHKRHKAKAHGGRKRGYVL